MGKTEADVKQGNKIYIVDPNPPEMEKHRPEDMFLYIKFKADNRNRSTYLGKDETTQTDQFTNTGTQGEINFIATQVNFNSDGQITPDPQPTYATTSYTNIGGIQESNSRGNLEGFGIKSIDIKYNASLVPTVDISFTDLRGSALFDVTEHNNRKSPYSIFFKMPYPIFTLSVKGYFGKTVDYCLHMINWTSNFDGTTGNFDINANFVGFQQAFLADMVLGNIIGAVNTSAGYNKLMKVYDDEREKFEKTNIKNKSNLTLSEIGSNVPFSDVESGKKLNVRKIDDFFVRVSKLQIETESIKRDSKELDKLKIINEQLNKLKRIQQFIGTPISKQVVSKNENEADDLFELRLKSTYETQTNDPKIIKTSNIKDFVLKEGKNYLSIRDYIIFNTININQMIKWFQTLTELINDYDEFQIEASIDYPATIDTTQEKTFLEDYPRNATTKEIDYKDFIDINVSSKDTPVKLNEVFNKFSSIDSPLNKSYITPNPNAGFAVGVKSPFIIASQDDLGRNNYKQNLNLDNLVKALNFVKRRSKLQTKIYEVEILADIQYEEAETDINEKLNKQLDFSPKVKDVFRILCNNTDAMLQTLADITKEAEKNDKKERRKAALRGLITDIPPDNKNSYAWPRIHQPEAKGAEEVYMGDIKNLINNYSSDFPEYHFVNEVFDNLVARRKKLQEISSATNLKNGLDTENWFPLNPVDYDENPFLLMNTLITSDTLKEEFIKQLLIRSCLLYNYSLFNQQSGSNNINDYANLEGINANKTIFSTTVRHMLIEILSAERNNTHPVTEKSLIDIAIDKKIIKQENGNYVLLEEEELPQIGGYPISGYRNDNVDYIIIKGTEDIINNGQKLWQTIKESGSYETIMKEGDKPKESVENFYKNEFKYYNYNSKLFYNVWISPFDANLYNINKKYEQDSLDVFKIDKIENVDNNPKFINQLYENPPASAPIVDYGSGLTTTTDFYKTQANKEAQAIILLSTFPFKTFEEGVLKTLRNNNGYDSARILNLPSLYLYFIGGLLYRSQYNTTDNMGNYINDPIDWTLFPSLYTPPTQYLSRLGVIGSMTESMMQFNSVTGEYEFPITYPIEEALLKLPKKTKDNLINFFTGWVKSPTGFDDFQKKVKDYTQTPIEFNNLTEDEYKTFIKNTSDLLVIEMQELSQMVIFAPSIFNPTALKNGLSIPINMFNSYRNSFQSKFINTNATNTNNTSKTANSKKDNESNNEAKLQIYNYFKNINDKWVASSDGKSYNACSGQNEKTSLIDYFKFLNRGWKDIGNDAVINLNSLLTLGNNLNTNMYFYISKVLRDSNFLFQILPTFIDYQNPKEVQDMFKPVTIVSDSNDKRGPIYTCIYVGSSSTSLDIGEENEYYYSNDGFTFSNNVSSTDEASSNKIPSDFNLGADEEREFALVAFRVAFGGENQGIFKNVSLSQQEHRETGEYFQALGDLVDKRGGTQRSYQGTDLLRLFKTRSYTCKVEALGCMNIQPLMYFDLQNVPFFHGAYLITSVNHNITPNHMTTSFTGLRISKYNSSPVTDVTAYLNIDLNEGNNDPPLPFTNLDFTTPLYSIGVKDPGSEITKTNWESSFKAETLKNIGVPDKIATEKNTEAFLELMLEAGIKSNAQAMMFLATALTQSDYFKNMEDIWETTPEELTQCIVYSAITNPCVGKTYCGGYGASKDPRKQIFAVNNTTPPTNIPLTYPNGEVVHWVLCKNPGYNQKTFKILFEGYGPGGTTQQYNLEEKYGNKVAGDAYRFRPRGYIPLVGKGQYDEIFKKKKYNGYKDNPNSITSQPFNAFEVATLVWKQKWSSKQETINKALQDKSYNGFVDKNGSAAMYAAVTQAQTWYSKSQEDYFIVFEKVLSMFNLLEYGDPV